MPVFILVAAAGLVLALVCGLVTGSWPWPGLRTGPWPWTGSVTARAWGPLGHQAYVWQRTWDGRVQAALTGHGTNFEQWVVLAAEVAWSRGKPAVVAVALDYPALRATGRPVGLALRLGAFSGPFKGDDVTAEGLSSLADSIVQTATTNGVAVSELQIDFDCAESTLAGYRCWLDAIRARLGSGRSGATGAPPALTITALPAWLKRSEFVDLVRATDGYVLQVHSLERPRDAAGADAFVLCDPVAAGRWVEQAARAGVPFRVALPTYGYRLTFDATGRFLGLHAEGPPKIFSEGAIQREVWADPAAMARLVRQWGNDRPSGMRGVIWYRLPVAGDSLNWSWPAMSEVIAGRVPASRLRVERRESQLAPDGLIEFSLTNAGPGDYAGRPVIVVDGRGRRLIAADGLRGFGVVGPGTGAGADTIEVKSDRSIRLAAGEQRPIGWVRFERFELAGEVTVEWREQER